MRRKIDAALEAKIALEALREQSTMADLTQRYEAGPDQICAWKKHVRTRRRGRSRLASTSQSTTIARSSVCMPRSASL